MRKLCFAVVAAASLLGACATIPEGPNVMVLPGSGKSLEEFSADDSVCRQWAAQQVGTAPSEASTKNTVTGGAVGTVVGAAAGAAVGAAAGAPATGAAVGSGVGLLGGTAAGAGRGDAAGWTVQHRYDVAYMQCMYTKGDQIPVPAGSRPSYTPQVGARRPTNYVQPGVPPPPPGPPPPPPPGPSR